jgi:hypothetical protein
MELGPGYFEVQSAAGQQVSNVSKIKATQKFKVKEEK